MLARSPKQKQSAVSVRMRRYRARRKTGARCYRLELSDRAAEGIVDMLISTGLVTEREAQNHRRLESAIAQLLEAQGISWSRRYE
jgi:hypothetical protein